MTPVTNASWTGGLFGLVELAQAIGIAYLVVGVRRAPPAGWARDLGAFAGALWVAGLTIRATIGAAVTVIEWAFFGAAVFAALAWTVAVSAVACEGRRALPPAR